VVVLCCAMQVQACVVSCSISVCLRHCSFFQYACRARNVTMHAVAVSIKQYMGRLYCELKWSQH
jgi:hypothetical protein